MSNVLVIGAARSGIAVSKLLNSKGYHVLLTDMKEIKEKEEMESKSLMVDIQIH